MKVLVIGAGSGGLALTNDLLARGFEVCLYATYDHASNIDAIKTNGGKLVGVLSNNKVLQKVHMTTTCPKEAAEYSDIRLFVLPAYAQESCFTKFIPFITSQVINIFLPGNFIGTQVETLMRQNNSLTEVTYIETSTIPHICRVNNPGEVIISNHTKPFMHVSIVNRSAHSHTELKSLLCHLFNQPLTFLKHPLAAGLYSVNGVFHPIPALFNLANIDNEMKQFYFYKDGMSEEVCKMMHQLDKERINLLSTLSIDKQTFEAQLNKYYRTPDCSLITFVKQSPYHNADFHMPDSIRHRYFFEDIPYILSPWKQIANMLQIETPVLSSVVTLAQVLINEGKPFSNRHISSSFLEQQTVEVNIA
ncbi:hypothetical protein C9J12_21345 [Photobacterium frigidiphilum]|uniref:NAD/NADP octopine/nopaline dehydrogenase n=1 Tax=Photobacterium frigidiphilum TaxID=264736 RepID=A0A2T3JAA6_9GAMM|nr:NAD/NADP-dependent octopine/nopaline dehydrogenase family protein [Photobacterium frigidiphilum]PSU45787.1 hypothetical protein C9J12_21345 [Photobacterium frigidiphilum]